MSDVVEPFSSGYVMLDVDRVNYTGDDAVAGHDLVDHLRKFSEEPLIRLGKQHYWLTPEWGVPHATVAFPENTDLNEDEPLLMAQNQKLRQLLRSHEVPQPR